MTIVAQNEPDVKLSPADLGLEECSCGGCREVVFRRGLCWGHFVEEEAQDAADYIFGDPQPCGLGLEQCHICKAFFVPDERGGALCPACEVWEERKWHDHVDEVTQAYLVGVGMG